MAMNQVLQLPWFSPVWVMQEAVMAKKATVYWVVESIDKLGNKNIET
jgi:hypothetical protein